MSEEVKNQTENSAKEFAKEDMESVTGLQEKYATTVAQIGQVEVELHLLKKRLDDIEELRKNLIEQYEGLQGEERDLVKNLNEKYGDGVLDLDSGRFIPSSQ